MSSMPCTGPESHPSSPDTDALAQHLAVHPPQVREERRLAQLLGPCDLSVYVDEHDAQVWLRPDLTVGETAAALATAHQVLWCPAAWPWGVHVDRDGRPFWTLVVTLPGGDVWSADDAAAVDGV